MANLDDVDHEIKILNITSEHIFMEVLICAFAISIVIVFVGLETRTGIRDILIEMRRHNEIVEKTIHAEAREK